MTLRFRRKKILERPTFDRDARLVFIATEGEKTERQYFEIFHSRKVKIVVLETSDCKSAPTHVLDRLNHAVKEHEMLDDDEKWLVLDVDHWAKRNHIASLKQVVQNAGKKGFQLALSNPCFECWLLLHFQDIDGAKPVTLKSLESQLRKHTPGHSKSSLKAEFYSRSRVLDAIRRAEAMDSNPDEPWPSAAGTRVYRTVKSILTLGATA